MTMTIDAPTTAPTVETVTLPYSVATLGGIYAVALHASKDDVTAVICTVQVTPRYFLATDRYSVGQWEHTVPADGYAAHAADTDPRAVLIPRTAAEWLAKQTPKVLGHLEYDLTKKDGGAQIEFSREAIIVTHNGDILAVTRFLAIGGQFPPVARLFPDTDDAPDQAAGIVALGPAQLEKFTKGAARIDKNAPLYMTPTKTANTHKPGPVLITFGKFRGLVQPNLMLARR